MTISEDIIAWTKTRPLWQQRVLQVLASGRSFLEADLSRVLEELLDPTKAAGAEPLDLALPTSEDASTVSLIGLRAVKGVNALTDDQALDFSPEGLNIVYGDNGSGKSGYARLIKEMVGARHPAEILPDVFEERPDEPTAVLRYSLDGEERDQKYPGVPDAHVKQMSFYDEHCGDVYLDSKSVLTYRPSALSLLDGLIEVCDRLRSAIGTRLADNQRSALDLGIEADTDAGNFLSRLSRSTTNDEITRATTADPGLADERAIAAREVARLQGSNAGAERSRLLGLAAGLAAVATRLRETGLELDQDAIDRASAELSKAKDLRDAATIAAAADFTDELPEVGGGAWRALWEAARIYSTSSAYPEHDFPVTHNGARCVLCQQNLDDEARGRLQRFDHFMRDTSERDAAAAESTVLNRVSRVRSLEGGLVAVRSMLPKSEDDAIDLLEQVEATVAAGEAVRAKVEAWLTGETPIPEALDVVEVSQALDVAAASYTAQAEAIDVPGFQRALRDAQFRLRTAESSLKLADSGELVRHERDRLLERDRLSQVLQDVATTSITAKSTQLTKLYAGDAIKNEFIRETERLRLRRVTIRDLGGNKGQLEQQPALEGARARQVRTRQVLSEGEQTAMGLAGFFTEAAFDTSRSTLILDDPVTSLDHLRRDHVARRLVELAVDRQVVVFTHDVTFAGAMQKKALLHDVKVSAMSVERHGSQGIPGYVRNTLPWKAKDFAARLQALETDLTGMKRDRDSFDQESWAEKVGSWAGSLSELWESCVSGEVLDEVFDRGTSEVRVMKFRILAAITHEDDTDFQTGYGACSKWARRHNKSPETNYVPPECDELETELQRVRAWQRRIKGYRTA